MNIQLPLLIEILTEYCPELPIHTIRSNTHVICTDNSGDIRLHFCQNGAIIEISRNYYHSDYDGGWDRIELNVDMADPEFEEKFKKAAKEVLCWRKSWRK